jgi:hypothetical protein
MDYLNCRDLPVWAQILVGPMPGAGTEIDEEPRQEPQKSASESAAAA